MSVAIPFNSLIKPLSRVISLDELKKHGEADLVVWWYCGLYKNQKAESQPNALLAFRKLEDGMLSDEVTFQRLPLTYLGQLRIGSIWKAGVSRTMVDFAVDDFEIDFRPGKWKYTSFESAFRNGTPPPYPLDLHPLQVKTDKNWFLEFQLASGGKLVVPCLEFFSRCYGRSQELNRILATYAWKGSQDAQVSRLYAPLDESEEPGRWKVKLRRRLNNGDTTFLAHAKYDPYTEAAAKSIYAQLESKFDPSSKAPMFIRIPPWFQGPADIRARGIWFDNKKSFLALQIIGCSDPDGILIFRDRENTNKTDGIDPENGEVAWGGVPEKIFVRAPDIVDLTGDLEPDHTAGAVDILDPDFVILGVPRTIVDIYGKKVTSTSGKKHPGDGASVYSSGEPHGEEKSVGYASIYAKPIIESNGALTDMWKAILHTKNKYPEKIQSVEWFTFEDGYVSTGTPSLVGLEEIREEDEPQIPTITRNWLYMDVALRKVRGVMIVRMIIEGVAVHVIELQRRPRTKKDLNDKLKESEESFKGFAIVIKNSTEFILWLKRFLSDVRYVRGIVQKLAPLSPGRAEAFTHKPAAHEEVPCEAAVLNALSKMGIKL